LRVALQEFQIYDLRFQIALSRGGDLEHLSAEIKAGGFRAAPGEREGDVTGATAQIEGAAAFFYLRQIRDAPFPAAVQAEALEVVQKIVATGDAGEEVADLRRALFAGIVKSIAHAGSLTAMRASGKAQKFLCVSGAALLVSGY
jgi:hypothetical protein